MPRASFNLHASAALRSYAPTDQNESKTDQSDSCWGPRLHASGPTAGGGCLLGSNWSPVIKLSEVLGDASALTCLIFFPNMEALVSMTNTTFLGTAGRSLGAK